MNPIEFPGSTEIKKPASMTDEQCFSVWAFIDKDEEGNVKSFLTAWKPSYEDLQALNRGEPIYIQTLMNRLPPMGVFTMDENGNCNDAN